MDRETFKQKMTVIKEKMEAIYKELHYHNAYIYHQKDYVEFNWKITKHIDTIKFILENCDARQTTEAFHIKKYQEFCGYLELDTNMWNDLNIYDYDPDHAKFILIKKDKEKDR